MALTLTLYASNGTLSYDQTDANFKLATQQLGVWNTNYPYTTNDLTTYNGLIYVAIDDSAGANPSVETSSWAVYVPPSSYIFAGITFADISPVTLDEGDLHSDSHTAIPTQWSVKTYVDTTFSTYVAYTDQKAIAALGGAGTGGPTQGLQNSSTIDWTYTAGSHQISGDVANNSLTPAMLNATAPLTNQILSYNGTGFLWINEPNPLHYYTESTNTPTTAPSVASGANSCVVVGDGANIVLGGGTPVGSMAIGFDASIQKSSYAGVFGGWTNASIASDYSVLAGGNSNTVQTTATYSGIFGGAGNTITTATYSFIAGGQTNNIGSGATGSSIIGGASGTVSSNATGAVVLGGSGNTASGNNSLVGGTNNTASSTNSLALGQYSQTIFDSSIAIASGHFSVLGDCQAVFPIVVRNQTTNNSATTLFVDGSTANLTLPSNGTWQFHIQVTARQTGGSSGTAGDSAGFDIVGAVKVVSGSASLIGSPNVQAFTEAASSAWIAALSVSSGNLLVRVTGETNKNINWGGAVYLMQVLG